MTLAEQAAGTRPLLSVITVVFNAADSLEATMRSVLDQDIPGLEYIVIDGGSTDGTVDIIRRYEHRLAYWVSEPDRGVYDAMNKGLDAARGSWICFMNSADLLWPVSEATLAAMRDDVLFVYGNTRLLYADGTTRDVKAGAYDRREVLMGMLRLYHQSVWYNAKYHRRFDLRYSIIADAVMTHEIARDNAHGRIVYVDETFSSYLVGGYSMRRPNEVYRQKMRYLLRRWPRFGWYGYAGLLGSLYRLSTRMVRGLP